jgi:hypothetical protein
MRLPSKQDFPKRRIVYVDDRIQKGLLIALVSLEVLLIAGTLWILYIQMSAIVEANLYRIHISQNQSIYPLLLKTVMIGLIGLIAVNALMLWVVGWLWARHVDSILNPFRYLVSKVEALDFREDEPISIPHKVVELALDWRHSNRQNMLKLRQEISRLDEFEGSPDALILTQSKLETIRKLCPNINNGLN